MLRARNENGGIIHIDEVKNREDNYYCLCCNKRVIIRKGRYNRGHFSHTKTTVKHSHDFSEHQYLQQYFYEKLEKIDIKASLEVKVGEHHRADLVCEVNAQKIAIEIQRTVIGYEKLIQRIGVYQKQGYRIIWIIPFETIRSETTILAVNNWILTLFYQKQIIIFYCRERQNFYYPYWALRLSSQKMLCDCLSIGEELELLFQLEPSYPVRKKKVKKLLVKEFNYWKQWFGQTAKYNDQLAQALYRTQKQVIEFPVEILATHIEMAMFAKSYFWIQVFITLLFLCEDRSVITIFNICKKHGYLQQEFTTGLNSISAYCAYLTVLRKQGKLNL